MFTLLKEILIFFASFVFVLIFVYFKVGINILQQVVLIILITILIFFNRSFYPNSNPLISKILHLAFLFISSAFIQFLVLSTGGFYSPFLILVHLYSIAVGFLLSLKTSASFLVLTIILMALNILLNQELKNIFIEDPGTIVLYVVSFTVIIPLSIALNRLYHLKDNLSKILSREIRLKDIRQKTLLTTLSEIVLITDRELNIISVNEAAERVLSASSSEMLRRPIFNFLYLRYRDGSLVNQKSLSIDRILEEKSTRIVNSLFLYTKNRILPLSVNIQIRPNVNLEGVADQITFVINIMGQVISSEPQKHLNLQQAKTRQSAQIEQLKNNLFSKGFLDLMIQVELLGKNEDDILYTQELTDHSFKSTLTLSDIASICRKIILAKRNFANALKVSLDFELTNFNLQDVSRLIPKGYNISPQNLTAPYFTAPLDVEWFDLIVGKLLDISILLSSSKKGGLVKLTIEREGNSALLVKIFSNYPLTSEEERSELFTEYNGKLFSKTNLRFGSGLEGYIAKTVTALLNIPLTVEVQKDIKATVFTLVISRGPRQL